MKHPLALFLALAALAGSLSAQARPVLGALMSDLGDEFVAGYAATLKGLAANAEVDLRLLDSRKDQAAQLDHLGALLAQGVKAFVIIPDSPGATEAMAAAIAARGGGAVFSRFLPTAAALKTGKDFLMVASPEAGAGALQADIVDQYFRKSPKRLGEGKTISALLLSGQGADGESQAWAEALKAGLSAKGYALAVIATAAAPAPIAGAVPDTAGAATSPPADETTAWAKKTMAGWLGAHEGGFNVVIAEDDSFALGAAAALLDAGLVDNPQDLAKDTDGDGTILKFPVLGLGATRAALAALSEGKLYATVLRDSAGQAEAAFGLALALAKGSYKAGLAASGLKPETKAGSEPPLDDPALLGQCYLVPFKAVTRDNYKLFLAK
jgi:methyl-galactoside transport system substrate-binding protein